MAGDYSADFVQPLGLRASSIRHRERSEARASPAKRFGYPYQSTEFKSLQTIIENTEGKSCNGSRSFKLVAFQNLATKGYGLPRRFTPRNDGSYGVRY